MSASFTITVGDRFECPGPGGLTIYVVDSVSANGAVSAHNEVTGLARSWPGFGRMLPREVTA